MSKRIKEIIIPLESVLSALERDSRNPNCYEETGKIRHKFPNTIDGRYIIIDGMYINPRDFKIIYEETVTLQVE